MRRGWSWARWRAWCLLACGAGPCRAGFGRGFDAFMTWAAIRQASGRKSSSFRPFSFRASLLPLRMSSRSPAGSVCLIWVGWRHRGGGWRRVRLAGVLGVSCAPAAWGRACRSRAVSAGRLSCWPCWGSLCGRWAWATISGQPAC